MIRTLLRRMAAVGAGALLLAACGGGSDGGGSGDFADRGSAACADFVEQLDDLAQPGGDDTADVEKWADEMSAAFEDFDDEIAGLKAPRDAEEDFETFQDAVADVLGALKDLGAAAKDDDVDAGAKAYGEMNAAAEAIEDSAKDIDFDDCRITRTAAFEQAETPTTEPPVTDPPITDPPITDPPVTDPPITDPPTTDVIDTEGSVQGVPIVDIGSFFQPPAGITFADVDTGLERDQIETLFLDTDLPTILANGGGVGTRQLLDSAGNEVAVVLVGFVAGDTMPDDWLTAFCGTAGGASTSPGGRPGWACDSESGTSFSGIPAERADFGIVMFAFSDGTADPAVLFDDFIAANP
jgi:hypothetical protein